MRCPKCDSENTKRVSLLVDEGTYREDSSSQIEMKRPYSTDRVTGTSHTAATGSSTLAQKLAPPQPKDPFMAGVVGLLLAAFAGFVLGMVVSGMTEMSPSSVGQVTVAAWAAFGFLAIRRAASHGRYNREVFEPALRRWEESFHCGRCGEIFQPS